MLRSIKSTQRSPRVLELRIAQGTGVSLGVAAISAAANTITFSSAHGYITGDRLLTQQDNTLPAGLSDATIYWVIKVSSTVIKLATTLANSLAGTAVDITDTGTLANTYIPNEKLIGMAASQAVLQVQATGDYLLTFAAPFAQVPIAMIQVKAADKSAYVSAISTTSMEFKTRTITTSASIAAANVFCDVLIHGLDSADNF